MSARAPVTNLAHQIPSIIDTQADSFALYRETRKLEGVQFKITEEIPRPDDWDRVCAVIVT